MEREAQNRKAGLLQELHSGDDILVLPCAWDAASAKVFEAEGARAIGTTSLGVAASLGYRDGEKIELHEYLHIVRAITRVVEIPVTVVIEAGFSDTVEGVANNIRLLLDTGAVGINVEDLDHSGTGDPTLVPVPLMIQKIQAIRAMSDLYGVRVFINARTDAVWLFQRTDEEAAFREATERGKAFGAAGADCVFVPGDLDLRAISRLVQSIPYPLNIVIKSKTPAVAELRKAGVKRASMGSGPMRASMGLTRRIAREAFSTGTYQTMLDVAIPLDEVQQMLAE